VGLLLPSPSLLVELHREPGSLVDAVPHSLEGFWSRRVKVSLGGVRAWTRPAEETLIHLTRASPAGPGLRPRQLFRRLRVTVQFRLPGLLRTLWLNLVRPAEGARLRRLSAENLALVEAMRGRSPGVPR